MTRKFKGDLVLEKDTVFEKSIEVEGNICGKDTERFRLKVVGDIDALNIDALNIDAWDIHARDIDAWDIHARDIDALNIDALNIDARDIDAWDIVCEKRTKKSVKSKTIARVFVTGKSELERKEW